MVSVSSPTTQINLSAVAPRVVHALLSSKCDFSDGKTTVTGFEVARRWSVDQALRCKSMVVPSAVASSILCGSFTRLMSTARQMRKQQLLFEGWPPRSFLKVRKVTYHEPITMTSEDAVVGLDELQHALAQWRPTILADNLLESRGLLDAKINRHVQLIRTLKAQLLMDVPTETLRTHPTGRFIEAVRAS